MKKYLLVMLLVMSFVVIAAVESDPSETVGYFKKTMSPNTWGVMSLPFNYDSLLPDAIFGTQFSQGDMLQDVYFGYNWTYYDGYGWYIDADPPLPLQVGSAYWVYRDTANPAFSYYILGTVDPQPVTVTVPTNGWTCFSLNECRNVDPNTLVIPSVIQGDMIQDVFFGYNWTWYDGYGWYIDADPPLPLEPTNGYWYYTSGTGYTWTYNPPARGEVSTPTVNRASTEPRINK